MKRIIINSYKPKNEIVRLLRVLNINIEDVEKVWHTCKGEMTVKFKDGIMQRFLISQPSRELKVGSSLKKISRKK